MSGIWSVATSRLGLARGLGFPDPLAPSSSITNSGSNSAGSGPLAGGSPSCRPLACREAFLEGERFREEDLPAFDADREGEACDSR